MSSINNVRVRGNVGGDPVIRTFNGGKKMATFSVATSDKWKDKKTGEVKEKTEWHTVNVFVDYFVNVIEEGVKKGTMVECDGKLITQKWDDDAGISRYRTVIELSGYNSHFIIIKHKNKTEVSENYEEAIAESANAIMEDDIPY